MLQAAESMMLMDVNPTGTSKQKFVGSLGHTSDDESGLVYMRARYMDPAIGRFASEDPACHGSNWYIYWSNNPINRFDPTGKEDPIADIVNAINKLLKDMTGQGLPQSLMHVIDLFVYTVVLNFGIEIAVASVGVILAGLLLVCAGAPIFGLIIAAGGIVGFVIGITIGVAAAYELYSTFDEMLYPKEE